MTTRTKRCQIATLWTVVSYGLATLLIGCSGSEPAKEKESAQTQAEVNVIPAKTAPRAVDPRLQQSFQEASTQEPPEREFPPPDMTVTGKSTGKMYEEIVGHDGAAGLWDKIAFVTAEGKRIQYRAALKTDLGNITIELWPDVAPNHVRSFLALAQVGYYNGLAFDRAVRQPVEDEKDVFLEMLEAGCPVGTGEPGYGSIGYWLKPEFSDKVKHLEGTVGACHGEQLESAAAKFYITLGKAPWLDGNWTAFGKVTQGLDIARTISRRPLRDDYFRPREPVIIRELAIQSQVIDP